MVEKSAFTRDIRKVKHSSGAYEWWYFDAIRDDGDTEFVIIFYEGNPFSRRYINRQQETEGAQAEDFPAISISVYNNNRPVYYSFTEVKKENATFGNDVPFARVGNHSMKGIKEDNKIEYRIRLDEELPSGDAIDADIKFESSEMPDSTFNLPAGKNDRHQWNIVQPKAQVTGRLQCTAKGKEDYRFNFKGNGYHDHNIGAEPLKQRFGDWYWGRFHLPDHTFVYYVMGDTAQDVNGWFIENDTFKVSEVFNNLTREDASATLYGLKTDRKLTFSNSRSEILVQQSHLLDNGPFYQRFSSDAFLNISSLNGIASVRGISEYLCPPRIYNRLYWPLTNMRIHYNMEKPHWVQRSKTLYRWTW